MKVVATLIISTVVVLSLLGFFLKHNNLSTINPATAQMQSVWNQWKAQYGVSYANAEEDAAKFTVFTQNYNKIMTHNSGNSSFRMALNKFADLTGEEFKSVYATCYQGEGLKGGLNDEYCPSAENCESFSFSSFSPINWETSGAVTGVKNQGECGSCWSFSTTGALEALNFLNHKILISFSEQQLVSCATQCEACNGCFPYLAMEYTAQAGIEPEKLYPYTSGNGQVAACSYNSKLAVKVNSGYQCVQQENAEQMYGALTQQPVSIAVEADQNAWQFYSSGVVNSECGASLDHAVLLVGYSNDENNEEAWYVKNSWGTDWGVSGYIYLGASAQNNEENGGYGVCGILRCGTIPTA